MSKNSSSTPHPFVSIGEPEWKSGKDRHRCASCAADYDDPVHIPSSPSKWPLILISEDCFVPQWAGQALRLSREGSTDASYSLILALAVIEECNLRRERLN